MKNTMLLTLFIAAAAAPAAQAQGWMHYGGDAGGTRYSPLAEIDRQNVEGLELAWQYRTGAIEANPKLRMFVDFQATPILLPEEAGGHLVACDPFSVVIALDPASGEERWRFDPEIDKRPLAGRFKCRGMAQWQDPSAKAGAQCEYRLYMPTPDRRLIAIDARDGRMCPGFGESGTVDVDAVIRTLEPASAGVVVGTQLLSPPTIVSGMVVVTTTANKFKSIYSLNGSIMAFDARSGELRWTFDPLVRDASTGFEPTPQEIGGGNVWVPMAADEERDLLFMPTASPAPNFWGAHRPGDNRYANSIVAIRASTGEYVWHFQVVHHDLWDKDNPAQPILADITKDGETIPAVIQLTKAGMAFVFHRETGESLFPIEERPVPTDGVPGEQVAPTQPFTVKPPPLVKQTISPDDAWGFTVFDRADCRRKIESLKHGSMYTPPSEQGTLMYPQVGGGSNWGGGAFDPTRNLLITPVSQIPYYVRMVPNDEIDPKTGNLPQAGAPMQMPGFIKGAPYGVEQGPLMSFFFSPCTAPPWNLLVAVDMAAGEIAWEIPFGRLDELMPVPIPLNWGTPSAGGPIVTAGGLIFIGATADARLHAYDIDTGEELWVHKAPTMAGSTPMTYEADGRQYVVFATGGHSWYYAKGIDDYLLAFALPE